MFFKNKAKKSEADASNQMSLGSRDRYLLSETIHIEEELIPAFVRPILLIVGTMVIAFFFWAAMTHMKEVARAPGEIIPTGQLKVVQHLDGGVVAEILTTERKLVKQGQVLLRIDGSQALADLKQMEARQDSLRLRAVRLKAFTDGHEPDFSAVGTTQSALISNQREMYITQLATRDSTISILDRQINQRTQRIHQLETALAVAKEHVALTAELSKMREDLGARRLINRTVLLETRRAYVTASGEVARLQEEIGVAKQELAEVQNRRTDTINQSQRDALGELGAVRAELAEVDESIERLKARVDRLEVRAPNQGYVQDMKVQTVGQVILPGALLMQIVPDNVVLEAEVRISPRDIGFVRVGQPVNVRVTSYDYSRFGVAKGSLKLVSASSVLGTDNRPYFRGLVGLNNPYVGDVPGLNLLKPGMSVEAEILTGDKTLLTYLSKPLIDVLSKSFRER